MEHVEKYKIFQKELVGTKDGNPFKVNGSRLKHYMVSEELMRDNFDMEEAPPTDGLVADA